jgi:hypothetical protein
MAATESDQDRAAEPAQEQDKEEGGASEEEFLRSGSGASEPTED